MAGGRPTKFAKKKKDEIYSDYLEYFQERKKVPPKSDKIWQEIKERYNLPNTVTCGAIYSAMLALFIENEKENTPKKVEEPNKSSSFNTSNDDECGKAPVNFKLTMALNVWNKIKPNIVQYSSSERTKSSREYYVMPSGAWTYTLSEAISKEQKNIPCHWCFKRGKIYISDTAANYIVVNGFCNTCQAKLSMTVDKKPKSPMKFIRFMCDVHDMNISLHEEHKNKQNIRVIDTENELLNGKEGLATAIRRQLLNDSTEDPFHRINKRVPTANAIRSVVKPMARLDGGVTKRFYLYTLIITSDGSQVPIYSMVTEDHTMNHIAYWLNEFISLFGHIPDRFVSDMSKVLLNSAARSFGVCADIDDYCGQLFNLAKTNISEKQMKCLIQIDVAHFIKNICQCPSLKSHPHQREFYIRATCLLIKCTYLKQAENMIHSILVLVVAKSVTKGDEFHTNKEFLDQLIATGSSFEIQSNVSDYQSHVGCILDEENIECHNVELKQWLKQIDENSTNESNENSEDNEKNEFNNKGFAKFLLQTCGYIVIFSKIGETAMKFKTLSDEFPSTASVERYFGYVKSTLHEKIPCRIDTFVCAHIELIKGMIIDAAQKYIDFVDSMGGISAILGNQASNYQYEYDIFSNDEECNVDEPNCSDITENDDFSQPMTIDDDCENLQCPACQYGDLPTGAHCCIVCKKAVHILEGCSISCGQEEGHGEQRKCISCVAKSSKSCVAAKSSKQEIKRSTAKRPKDQIDYADHPDCIPIPTSTTKISKRLQKNFDEYESILTRSQSQSQSQKSVDQLSSDMKAVEVWKKSTRSAKSYLNPAPHWNLPRQTTTTKKLGHLMNGNLSTTVYTINNRKVALKNTCAYDVILHLFASVYAYFPHVRQEMDEASKTNEMFHIAINIAQK